MAQFSYSQYNTVVENAKAASNTSSVKVGFFKLSNDGDEALVRFNVSSLEDLHFASVHQLGPSTKWMQVSCLKPIGVANADNCELCQAIAAGNTSIGAAKKKVFVEMVVSYKDRVTKQWSAPVPVIWERPAGFSRDLANKLRDIPDLRTTLFKITRNGAANDRSTTYSIDYAIPTVYKPELVPADFSAFGGNFKINKHSYWEKTEEEIHIFLTTGAFPEVKKETTAEQPTTQTYTQPVQQTYAQPTYVAPQPQAYVVNESVTPAAVPQQQVVTPVTPTPVAPVTPVQPAATPVQPTVSRNFDGFSF